MHCGRASITAAPPTSVMKSRPSSLDHLVGAGWWNFEAERPVGLEIDH
jgi:hypothetical protein